MFRIVIAYVLSICCSCQVTMLGCVCAGVCVGVGGGGRASPIVNLLSFCISVAEICIFFVRKPFILLYFHGTDVNSAYIVYPVNLWLDFFLVFDLFDFWRLHLGQFKICLVLFTCPQKCAALYCHDPVPIFVLFVSVISSNEACLLWWFYNLYSTCEFFMGIIYNLFSMPCIGWKIRGNNLLKTF